jgi:hypothetical protein
LHLHLKLSESTIFVTGDAGPIEQVKQMWRGAVDSCDVDALARDCCALLLQKMGAFDLSAATDGEAAEGEATTGEHLPRAGTPEITPEAIKRHFLVCEVTKGARMDALKGSFRHKLGAA